MWCLPKNDNVVREKLIFMRDEEEDDKGKYLAIMVACKNIRNNAKFVLFYTK